MPGTFLIPDWERLGQRNDTAGRGQSPTPAPRAAARLARVRYDLRRNRNQSVAQAPAHIDANVRRLPSASVAEFVSPWLMLQPSATSAAAPMSSPPAKIFRRLEAAGNFQANWLVVHAATKAPSGTPRAISMLQVTRLG